ncbi:MAG: hypothetical protein ACFE8M_11545 [Candidatus Hermodarchaeota archaeon]
MDKKKKIIGSMEDNIVKSKNGFILLRLDRHNDLFLYDNTPVGFILNSKMCTGENPIFEFITEKGEILDNKGKPLLYLEGNSQEIKLKDYFGVATIFLESIWTENMM